MGIREEMIALLRSPQVLSIDFAFASLNMQIREVRVNRTSFERVAQAIESNRLAVTSNTTNLVAGAGGQYAFDNRTTIGNSFIIPRLGTSQEKGGAVHEAVHASFDITRSVLPQIDNEAAGYIAGAIYMTFSGGFAPRADDSLHIPSCEIAVEYRQTGLINQNKLNQLRNALSRHPVYCRWVGGTFAGDGLRAN